MATHSCILVWKTPWTQGPDRLQPMGSLRVGHNWTTSHVSIWASLVAQMVKNLPTIQETQVQFLGQEDPLEKRMATHSNILAWKIPWTEEPSRPQSMGLWTVGQNWMTNTSTCEYLNQNLVWIFIYSKQLSTCKINIYEYICIYVNIYNTYKKI